MMLSLNFCVVILALIGTSLAFTAEYIPKSYYVIHSDGAQEPTVFFRQKRSLQEPLLPLVRMRRSDTGSGAGSGSFSSASSFAGAGAGAGGGDAIFFDEHLKAGFDALAKMHQQFINSFPGGAGVHGGASTFPAGFPGAPSGGAGVGAGCTNCGGGNDAAGHGLGGAAPNLHARFGGDDGVSYSGTSQGGRGVYSASSSSIDSDGNVKYSVKSGKY